MLVSFSPTLFFHLSRGHSYLSTWLNLKVVLAYLCNVSAPGFPDLIKTAHLRFQLVIFLGSIFNPFILPSPILSCIVKYFLSQTYHKSCSNYLKIRTKFFYHFLHQRQD